jgi:hypothetical protein
MAEIRDRNMDISTHSEHTQGGVSSLQASMHDVAENLSQFRIEEESVVVEELSGIDGNPTAMVYGEEEMVALESGNNEEARIAV